ncbi:alpha/beta fold hydrolase [Rudanella paleaurantiibacter]|uniref:alpha/beta fold hydrolase n=1 Tax=Rudanella paleaurantiibacter TaxID=2614655 RepID=UPI001FE432AC|nr:alpha/beta hydrolase [Rudanella paleaurantiibacter]
MALNTNVLVRNNVQIKGNVAADRTLVFAHGFGTDQSAWSGVWPAFADTHRIVLFDYVGANETTVAQFKPERYKTLYAFADDLLDILEALNLTQVDLIGHSVGGTTGMLAAIQEPERFSRLVLMGSSPRYLNDEGYTGGFTEQDLNALFAQMKGNYYGWVSGFAPFIARNPDNPHVADQFAQTLAAMRPDVGLSIARTIFESDYRAVLANVPHPVLVIQPEHDSAVPKPVGEYFAQRLPNAQLIVLPTEGHLPHLSHPELVVNAIRPFLQHVPVDGLEPV